MKELGDIELHRKATLKAWRTLIRLKHSLAADAEINSALPSAELDFNKRVAQGQLPSAAELYVDIVAAADE